MTAEPRHVRLGEVIDEQELRAQLDHARSLFRCAKKELIWLAGNTFYGKTQMFSPDFINALDVPAARIRTAQGRLASTNCTSTGPTIPTMWEIPALSTSCACAQPRKARAASPSTCSRPARQGQLWTKVERLQKLDGLRLSMSGHWARCMGSCAAAPAAPRGGQAWGLSWASSSSPATI